MSSRKPPSNPDDWDDFDIPSWDEPAPPKSSRTYSSSGTSSQGSRSAYPDPLYDDYDTGAYPPRQSTRPASSSLPPTRLSSRVPTRSTRPSQDPYRDPYSDMDAGYADPYPAAPAYGAATSQYDLYAEPAYDATWDEAVEYPPASQPSRRTRKRSRSTRSTASIAKPAISDQGIVALVGAALLGLLAMIGVVWYGLGDLSGIIPWHLNASGDVDRWVSDATLWRIPFGVLMSLIIGLVLGAYLWKRDRFAARFIIASMCIVQILAWVAVVDQLW